MFFASGRRIRDVERRADALRDRIERLEQAAQANCDVCSTWDAIFLTPNTEIGRAPWTKAGGSCPKCGREPQIIRLAFDPAPTNVSKREAGTCR